MPTLHWTPQQEAVANALHAWRPKRFTPEWIADWLNQPARRVRRALGCRQVGPAVAANGETLGLELPSIFRSYALAHTVMLQLRAGIDSGRTAAELAAEWGLPADHVAIAARAANRYALKSV